MNYPLIDSEFFQILCFAVKSRCVDLLNFWGSPKNPILQWPHVHRQYSHGARRVDQADGWIRPMYHDASAAVVFRSGATTKLCF